MKRLVIVFCLGLLTGCFKGSQLSGNVIGEYQRQCEPYGGLKTINFSVADGRKSENFDLFSLICNDGVTLSFSYVKEHWQQPQQAE